MQPKKSKLDIVHDIVSIAVTIGSFGLYAVAMHVTFTQVSPEYRSASQRLYQALKAQNVKTRLHGRLARDVAEALDNVEDA